MKLYFDGDRKIDFSKSEARRLLYSSSFLNSLLNSLKNRKVENSDCIEATVEKFNLETIDFLRIEAKLMTCSALAVCNSKLFFELYDADLISFDSK